MSNEYVEMYCGLHSLTIQKTKVKNENLIFEGDKNVGIFYTDSKYVFLGNSKMKKSDLLQLILEEVAAHR